MSKKIIFTDHTDSVLNAYLRDISKHKILDASEIRELVIKAQSGDTRARDKVVTSNLRFVVTIAKQFQGRGVPLLDLISSGNEGLIHAVSKYDVNRGVAFLSYAIWWIKQAIYNSIYWQGKSIRLPMSQQMLVLSILDATTKFIQKHHRNPSSEEIAEITNIPRKQIDYLSQFSNKPVSVDDFIGGDEDNNQVCDIIPDGEMPLEDQVNRLFVIDEIKKCLLQLSIREHDLICMWFGIGMHPVNPKVIQDMFGVCGERIRQIKERALDKLGKRFRNKLLNLK